MSLFNSEWGSAIQTLKLFGSALERANRGDVKKHEATKGHMFRRCESLHRGRERDRRRVAYRIAVGSCRNRRKCQRSETVLISKANRFPMTTSQRLGLATLTAAIDWPDRMNNVFRGQVSTCGDDRPSGWQGSNPADDLSAFGKNG